MFTGETKESLCEGMNVAVNVRVVKDDFAIVKLDCGIEGRVESHEVSYRQPIKAGPAGWTDGTGQASGARPQDFICKFSMRGGCLAAAISADSWTTTAAAGTTSWKTRTRKTSGRRTT